MLSTRCSIKSHGCAFLLIGVSHPSADNLKLLSFSSNKKAINIITWQTFSEMLPKQWYVLTSSNHMTSQVLNEAELSDKLFLGNKKTNETLQETS